MAALSSRSHAADSTHPARLKQSAGEGGFGVARPLIVPGRQHAKQVADAALVGVFDFTRRSPKTQGQVERSAGPCNRALTPVALAQWGEVAKYAARTSAGSGCPVRWARSNTCQK